MSAAGLVHGAVRVGREAAVAGPGLHSRVAAVLRPQRARLRGGGQDLVRGTFTALL